jgi:hypothetical protein
MKLTYDAKCVNGAVVPLAHFAAKVAVGRSKFKPGQTIHVTEESQTKKRTIEQNSRYWGLLVPAFAEWTGYEAYPEHLEKQDLKALKDSAHRTLKAMFIGPRTIIRTLPNGRTIEEVQEPSTTELTTAEFATLQDQAEKLLNDNGIYLPAEERTR